MKLLCAFLVLILVYNEKWLKAQDSLNSIRPDQEGFYPHAPKTAIVAGYGAMEALQVKIGNK